MSTQTRPLHLLAAILDQRAKTWRADPPSGDQAAAWLERIARIMRAAA